MQENGLTGEDRKLMVKYGFMPDENCLPSSSTIFAYRTFMAMKGDYMENGATHEKKPEEFKSNKIP